MRLPRTDLVPVLTIVAGGVIGASLSFTFLALSPSDDVLAPVPVVEVAPVEISPAQPPVPYENSERGILIRLENGQDAMALWSERLFHGSSTARPLVYIDGVRISGGWISVFDSLDPDDIESIELMKRDLAVALYGEAASAGLVQISLKEERP